jgi:predicted O-methyltransferase YrrM
MSAATEINPIVKFFKRMKRYDVDYVRRKIYDLKIRKAIEAKADDEKLERMLAGLRARHGGDMGRLTESLLPYYRDYVSSVSNEIMAASMEISAFLLLACEIRRPRRILDLGSGFSSFVFRFYASKADPRPEVWSVDDAREWLDRTGAFIARHGLPAGNLLAWENLDRDVQGRFDLVFYDFGPFDLRKSSLEYVLGRVESGGIVVLDDMHSADYGLFVKEVLKEKGFGYASLWSYTNDRFGRFSFLARR